MKKNGKFQSRRRARNAKPLAILLAMTLMIGCAVGGTLAWLTATDDPVTNTFTTSDISITLTESEKLDFQMVPGWTIDKDPIITFSEDSEDCYLFLKVEKKNKLDNYIAYQIDENNWTQLKGEDGKDIDGVYYAVAKDNSNGKKSKILAGGSYTDPMGTENDTTDDITVTWMPNQVAVKPSVTKDMMATAKNAEPKLIFTAYAVQLYKSNNTTFEPWEAWDIAKNLGSTSNTG